MSRGRSAHAYTPPAARSRPIAISSDVRSRHWMARLATAKTTHAHHRMTGPGSRRVAARAVGPLVGPSWPAPPLAGRHLARAGPVPGAGRHITRTARTGLARPWLARAWPGRAPFPGLAWDYPDCPDRPRAALAGLCLARASPVPGSWPACCPGGPAPAV